MARVLLPKKITRISKDHMEDDNLRKKIKVKKGSSDHMICGNKLISNNIVALKVDTAITKKKPAKRSRKPVSKDSLPHRTSTFRGVTRHRWTGRYEAHLWDKHCWNQSQNKKGKQVYLGAYDDEEAAAHAYDLAALKYWGPQSILNFPLSMYEEELKGMEEQSREEYIGSLRRKSSGFSRGVSKYRGVARHHHNGRWEARIGRVLGNKYLYLGTFATQEEAAAAYDMAAIEHRGLNAVTNFDLSRYTKWLSRGHREVNAPLTQSNHQATVSTMLSLLPASPSDKYTSEDTVAFSDTTSTSPPPMAAMSSGDDVDSKSCLKMSSKGFFPDDIQTLFECTQKDSGFSMIADASDHLIHIGAEHMIFGEAELNSFASSIFNFDHLHGSLSI